MTESIELLSFFCKKNQKFIYMKKKVVYNSGMKCYEMYRNV